MYLGVVSLPNKLLSKSHLLIGFMFGGLLFIVGLGLHTPYLFTIWYLAFVGLTFGYYNAISKPAIERLKKNETTK